MRKALLITTIIALVALSFAAFSFALYNSPFAHANGQTIHVIEHAITDTVGDVPPKGDSLGDVLAFHNPVFDPSDEHQVGHDNGNCVRTVTGNNGVWECFWTVFLKGGQITVEGPFYTNGTDSILAITGGTGVYLEARGQMLLHARGNPVGSEYDFVYTLAD
jgi:allene oxide cyclase